MRAFEANNDNRNVDLKAHNSKELFDAYVESMPDGLKGIERSNEIENWFWTITFLNGLILPNPSGLTARDFFIKSTILIEQKAEQVARQRAQEKLTQEDAERAGLESDYAMAA